MRKALELSTTTQPALAAMGANSLEMPPPALNSAMSMPRKGILRQFLDGDVLAAKGKLLAHGTGRSEQRQFPDGKIAFLERLDHLDADGARRADHGHMRFMVHIRARNIASGSRLCQRAVARNPVETTPELPGIELPFPRPFRLLRRRRGGSPGGTAWIDPAVGKEDPPPSVLFSFHGGVRLYDDLMFSQIRSVHFVGICGTAMASAAAAMRDKGVQVTGSDQNVYPPMSTFLAERKIEVISGYAEQNLAHQARPGGHWQRHLARQPGSRVRAGPQAALLLAARTAEGVLHPRQALAGGHRHPRQDHHHLAARPGSSSTTVSIPASSSAASPTTSARAPASPTANGSSSRATNTTPPSSTSAASSSITCPRSRIINNLEFDHADIFRDLERHQDLLQAISSA